MYVQDVFEICEKFAPKKYSDTFCEKYDAYDNVGVFYDTKEEVKKILFSLDFSTFAIEKAISVGANLMITHHPAIYGKTDKVSEKIATCIKNGISVISMHLNLDVAKGGIDFSLAEGIAKCCNSKFVLEKTMNGICGEEVGYGKVFNVNETELAVLKNNVKKEFSTENVCVFSPKGNKIKKVAVFCGAGGDEEGVNFALKSGADLMVSSDFKHHVILMAVENGLSVMTLTHCASENYGFKKFYEKFVKENRESVGECVYYTDEILL